MKRKKNQLETMRELFANGKIDLKKLAIDSGVPFSTVHRSLRYSETDPRFSAVDRMWRAHNGSK